MEEIRRSVSRWWSGEEGEARPQGVRRNVFEGVEEAERGGRARGGSWGLVIWQPTWCVGGGREMGWGIYRVWEGVTPRNSRTRISKLNVH